MDRWDTVILGAGAAGLMCAIEAGRRGKRVLILEKSAKPAEKIRISGGGRCNFTNLDCAPSRFLSNNPHFCKSALKRYTQRDFITRIEKAGIAYHEKTLGQLFCDGSAREIIDMLLADLADAGGQLKLETEPLSVERLEDGYSVRTVRDAFTCSSVVIATGGKSIPKMGATGFAYDIARQFGLKVIEPRPALVPFTFTDPLIAPIAELAGVSVDARASCGKTSFDEAMLFTHRGLSGPAILQISSFWKPGEEVLLDTARGQDAFARMKALRAGRGKLTLPIALAMIVPKRLAAQIAARTHGDARLADLSDAKLQAVAAEIHAWRVKPNGTEGWRTAEVTAGGVDTDELSSQTMEARKAPGLYFIGECVDVTGWLGGYNFQWAWSSGWAAGQAV